MNGTTGFAFPAGASRWRKAMHRETPTANQALKWTCRASGPARPLSASVDTGGKMTLDCQYVSATEAGGEVFQILMEAKRDQKGGPYLLLQRAFLEEDEGDDAPCYVETNGGRLTGHYPRIEATLTRGRLIIRLPPPVSETIEVRFKATDEEFREISRMLELIVR